MTPVNVAILARPVQGGMQKHIMQLLRHLDRDRFHLHFIGPSRITEVIRDLSIPAFPLELSESFHPGRKLLEISRLRAYLRQHGITILHCHGVQAGAAGRLAAHGAGTPVVICTFHNLIYNRPYLAWQKRLMALGNRLLHHKTSCFIAVSQALKQQLVECEGFRPEKIEVIYNGLETGDFLDEHQLPRSLSPGKPIIGMLGRLVEEKGADLFLQCARVIKQAVPEAEFWIGGEGPQRPRLQQQAAALGLLSHIRFCGRLDDPAAFLDSLAVLVVPSRSEGFSLVTLEAMARAKPVVAFAVGALPELIISGHTGLLLPPGDVNGMALAVIRLLQEPAYAASLGLNGYERARHNFTVTRMIRQTEAVYRQTLARLEKGRTDTIAVNT
ncbi:MAG TPA: glycosyltransferase family 4 protein [Clostridia bacterium]|nr:glycosyltransferase family 4 protein [Clostridia bacterium]